MVNMERSYGEFTARLDRLPMGWPQYRVIVLMMILIVVEAIDISITSAILPPLQQMYHLSASQTGLFAAASTFGVVVGLIPSGFLQDRLGRKIVSIVGMLVFCVFTGAMAVTNNILLPTLFRFLAGLGAGAVFPIPYTYLAEFMPATYRARGVAGGQVALAIGYVIAPLVALLIYTSEPSSIGWRTVCLVAFLPVALVPLLFKYLPESPRWLVKQRRFDRVEAIVSGMESYFAERGITLTTPAVVVTPDEASTENPWVFWSRPYITRWFVVVVMFIGSFIPFYLSLTYLPLIMKIRGYSLVGGIFFSVLLNAWSILGNLGQGISADKFGRRWTVQLCALLGGISLVLFPYIESYGGLVVLIGVAGLCAIPIFLVVKTYTGESFPTYSRATAAGAAETASRLVGGVLPIYLTPLALKAWGVTTLYWIAGLSMIVLVAGVSMAFHKETRGISMELTSAAKRGQEAS